MPTGRCDDTSDEIGHVAHRLHRDENEREANDSGGHFARQCHCRYCLGNVHFYHLAWNTTGRTIIKLSSGVEVIGVSNT